MTDYDNVANQKVLGKDTPMADELHHRDGGARKSDPTLDDLLTFMQGEPDPQDQMRSMCDPHLERKLSREEASSLVEIKSWFDTAQKETVDRLIQGISDRQAYLTEMNALLSQSMARYRAVLGDDRFLQVFGDAGLEPEKLIDRDIFLGRRSEQSN